MGIRYLSKSEPGCSEALRVLFFWFLELNKKVHIGVSGPFCASGSRLRTVLGSPPEAAGTKQQTERQLSYNHLVASVVYWGSVEGDCAGFSTGKAERKTQKPRTKQTNPLFVFRHQGRNKQQATTSICFRVLLLLCALCFFFVFHLAGAVLHSRMVPDTKWLVTKAFAGVIRIGSRGYFPCCSK